MANDKKFEISYLPLFEKDLSEIIDYITYQLKNPEAASNLIRDVENAILDRLPHPSSFEPFHSLKDRKNAYIIFYVVTGNVMEVSRILYNKRNRDELI